MKVFQALRAGNVGGFTDAIKDKSPVDLSRLKDGNDHESLLHVAVNIANPDENQKKCISLLVKNLGNELIPTTQDGTPRKDTVDPLLAAVKAGNVEMVKILFEVYCQNDALLEAFWGKSKAALVKKRVLEAIAAIYPFETLQNKPTVNADQILQYLEKYLDNKNDIAPEFSKGMYELLDRKEFLASLTNDYADQFYDREGHNSAALVSESRQNNLAGVTVVVKEEIGVTMGGAEKAVAVLGNKAECDSDFDTSLSILNLIDNINFKDKATTILVPGKTLPNIISEQKTKIEAARAKKEAELKAAVKEADERGNCEHELNALKDFYTRNASDFTTATQKYLAAKAALALKHEPASSKNQTQNVSLLNVFRANDLNGVKEQFPSPQSLDKVDSDALTQAIAQVGEDKAKTADDLKVSIAILESLYAKATALDRSDSSHPLVAQKVSIKIGQLRTLLEATLVENIREATNPEQVTANFTALKKFFFGDSVAGSTSYSIVMERFIPFVAALGLDADGNKLPEKPAPVSASSSATSSLSSSTSASSSSSSSSKPTGSIQNTAEYKAVFSLKEELGQAFMLPQTTTQEFEKILENFQAAIQAFHQTHNRHSAALNLGDEVSAALLSIRLKLTPQADVPGVSPLEYACIKGVNSIACNEAVLFAFSAKLTHANKHTELKRIKENHGQIHHSMQKYVEKEYENALVALARAGDLSAIEEYVLMSVLDANKSSSDVNDSISLLRKHFEKDRNTNSMENFASALFNLSLPTRKRLLLHTLEMPENAISETKRTYVVTAFHYHLGASFTDGKIENDPLVEASKLARTDIVALLLEFYADPNHWESDAKRAAVKDCINAALTQLGADCVTNPAKFLPVFEKFYKSDKLCSLPMTNLSEDGLLGVYVENIATSIEQGLMTEVARLFQQPSTTEAQFELAVTNLKQYHLRITKAPDGANALFLDALQSGVKVPPGDDGKTLLAYAAEKGITPESSDGVNPELLEYILASLVGGERYSVPHERQALYDSAADQPQVKAIIRRIFTQKLLVDSTGPTTGLDLSVDDAKAYIVDLFVSPYTSSEQFNAACKALKEKLPPQEGVTPDDLLSQELLAIKFNVDSDNKTLLEYACSKGVNQADNPNGVNPAVLLAYLGKHKDDAVRPVLPSFAYQDLSVQPYLTRYTANTVTPLKPTPTYKSSAKTGAAVAAGLVALAIVGVLAEAFLFGEDRNMEKKLYTLANWCWRNPFGNSSELNTAGHFESHEAEMLSCVGATMVIGAAFIGGLGGAGVHGIKEKIKP